MQSKKVSNGEPRGPSHHLWAIKNQTVAGPHPAVARSGERRSGVSRTQPSSKLALLPLLLLLLLLLLSHKRANSVVELGERQRRWTKGLGARQVQRRRKCRFRVVGRRIDKGREEEKDRLHFAPVTVCPSSRPRDPLVEMGIVSDCFAIKEGRLPAP